MLRLLVILLLVSVLFLVGCSRHYWYCSSKSFSQCSGDLEQCRECMHKHGDVCHFNYESYDTDYEKACMRCKGYRLSGGKQLPLEAKRLSTSDYKYGASGSMPCK
jgi:hypothetical protein